MTKQNGNNAARQMPNNSNSFEDHICRFNAAYKTLERARANDNKPRSSYPCECPRCKTSLIGEPIPKDSQENFGGETHYSRAIGISNYDSIYAWMCPECGAIWPRSEPASNGYRTCSVQM